MSELMDEFGPAGYGVWWIIIEKIAAQMDETERCFASYSIKKWSNSCRISSKKFQKIVSFLTENGCFSVKKDSSGGGKIEISCKNILKYRDEYTKKMAKTLDIVWTNSGATPDPRARALTDTDTDTDTDTEKDTPIPPDGSKQIPKPKTRTCPYSKIVESYHRACPDLPRIEFIDDVLKTKIRARCDESKKERYEIEWWDTFFFEKVARSDYLMGKKNGWKASLPWIVGKQNFSKVINNSYPNNSRPTTGSAITDANINNGLEAIRLFREEKNAG